MLKKEHIRKAIEAVSKRDPEIGYTLDEMLSTGRIAPVSPPSDAPSGDDFYFLIDEIPVAVRRIIFFNAGTAPIEERLLIAYGEMLKKQQYALRSGDLNYHEAARDIRASGVGFMVTHEIEYALAQLKHGRPKPGPGSSAAGFRERCTGSDDPDGRRRAARRLESIKQNRQPLSACPPPEEGGAATPLCYRGTVDHDVPALFARFPYGMDALMQVAELNLEFFHVRFLLSCLIKGLGDHIFVCIVEGRIEGMVYLTFKKSFASRAVEIQYIATVRGRAVMKDDVTFRAVRGVGTILVAGVWMVWKTLYREAADLLLNSEVGARSFYDAMGFHSRGLSEYALKHPRGRLATAILDMAGRCPDLTGDVVGDLASIVKDQFRILRKKGRRHHMKIKRQTALDAVKTCFRPGAHPALAETARCELNRHRKAIPESQDLCRLADRGE